MCYQDGLVTKQLRWRHLAERAFACVVSCDRLGRHCVVADVARHADGVRVFRRTLVAEFELTDVMVDVARREPSVLLAPEFVG